MLFAGKVADGQSRSPWLALFINIIVLFAMKPARYFLQADFYGGWYKLLLRSGAFAICVLDSRHRAKNVFIGIYLHHSVLAPVLGHLIVANSRVESVLGDGSGASRY